MAGKAAARKPEPITAPPPFQRRRRHWKERFDANAPFLWSRPVTIDGKQLQPGTDVRAGLLDKARLKRYWLAGAIQRKDFALPVPMAPELASASS